MFYLLSWRGRGYVAGLGILLAVGLLGLGVTIGDAWGFVGFGVGWLAAGVACWLLDRPKVDGVAPDAFCGLRLRNWVFVYGFFAFMFLPIASMAFEAGGR